MHSTPIFRACRAFETRNLLIFRVAQTSAIDIFRHSLGAWAPFIENMPVNRRDPPTRNSGRYFRIMHTLGHVDC